MTPYFFSQSSKVTVKRSSCTVDEARCKWALFYTQQDGAPAHNGKKVQEFISVNVPEFWPNDIWPPSSPDTNPLDYYVWIICEKEVNKQPHGNKQNVMMSTNKEM